jgi:zinc protease
MKSFLIVALLGSGVCAFAAALTDKEVPPAGSAPKPFSLPATEDFALPNGLKVTIVPYGIVPKVAVRVYVDAGALRESADRVWISKVNARLMKEGTKTRTGEQVARDVADMGGQLEIEAESDYTTAGGVVLSDFGPRFVALLADLLENASLPAPELSRIKADLGRELAVEKSRPGPAARERFLQTLFPDQPYGRVYPDDSTLGSYRLQDVKEFYDKNFAAKRAHLYIVGKLDSGLKQAITESFSRWKSGEESPVPAAQPIRAHSLTVIDRPGAPQSTLYLGLPVANPQSPDFIALDVMDSLLGGSFASRITANIREQKGYTYSPRSTVGTYRNLAYWAEIADVTTASTGASLKEIFYEVDRIRKEPPSEAELKGIQNYLSGIFVLRNTASPDAVIAQLHFVDSQALPRSYLSTFVQKVGAVKPSDIQRVAESYITPSKMTIVVVGDKAKMADQIKAYETVTQ